MSTPKKRKLNSVDSPQPMSAFALRKKLLAEKTAAVSSPEEEAAQPGAQPVDPIQTGSSAKNSTQRKSGKPKGSREGTGDIVSARAALEESLSTPAFPSEPAPALDQTPVLSRSPSPVLANQGDDLLSAVQTVQLSSFKPSKRNVQRKRNGNLVLQLVDGERLVILGSYGVRVDSGEVTINGATLQTSKQLRWVHAPHCHALPVIRCVEGATIELCSHPGAETLRELGNLSPLFGKIWNEATESTFQILYSAGDGPKRAVLQDLVSPPEWNREIARLLKQKSKPYSIMITGPKSSGKSTFGKILMNRFITANSTNSGERGPKAVAVLDLDPGQPEYCVAGQIALTIVTEPVLGPSFSRPLPDSGIRLIRCHALAAVSPASNPELYLQCAMDLMTRYRNSLGSYPLFINTPGWVQGTGLDLLVSLIDGLRPTEVIYMSQAGPAEAVESLQEACKFSGFSTLPSQTTQYSLRTAAHLRSMQTMSYFHARPLTGRSSNILQQWTSQPLTTVPPLQVGFRGSNRGFCGIMCYDYQAPADMLADAINGTILAVVEVESKRAFRGLASCAESARQEPVDTHIGSKMDLDNEPPNTLRVDTSLQPLHYSETLTPEGIPFIDTSQGTTLDPQYSQSLGLALVRGIDVENGQLQLLTPIPLERIEEIASRGSDIVLISSRFDPPTWAYTEDFYCQSQEDEDEDEGILLDITMDVEKEESSSDTETSDGERRTVREVGHAPWIEVLRGNQKRGAGSRVLRVRRDLGKT